MQSCHADHMQPILQAWTWYPLPSIEQAINDLKSIKNKIGVHGVNALPPHVNQSFRIIKLKARWYSTIKKLIAENIHQSPLENRHKYITLPFQDQEYENERRAFSKKKKKERKNLWYQQNVVFYDDWVIIRSMQVANILILLHSVAVILLLNLSQFVTLARALFPLFFSFHLSSFHMEYMKGLHLP